MSRVYTLSVSLSRSYVSIRQHTSAHIGKLLWLYEVVVFSGNEPQPPYRFYGQSWMTMQRGRALLGLPRGQPYARPTNPAHLSKKDTSRYGWTCCFSSIFTVIYVQLCGTSVSYPRVHAHMHSFCISFIQVCRHPVLCALFCFGGLLELHYSPSSVVSYCERTGIFCFQERAEVSIFGSVQGLGIFSFLRQIVRLRYQGLYIFIERLVIGRN